jgi:phosphate transport system permease protein
VAIVAPLPAGGPDAPARPLIVSGARTRRRIRLDGLVSRLVVVGGIIVIVAILAILLVIVAEVYPLFTPPSATLAGSLSPAAGSVTWDPPSAEALGVDEYRELAFIVDRQGALRMRSLRDGRELTPVPVPELGGATVSVVAPAGPGRYVIGTGDGRVIPLEMKFEVTFPDGSRRVTPEPVFGEATSLDPERRRPLQALAHAGAAEGGPVTVAQLGPTELVIETVVEKKALIGPSRKEASRASLPIELDGEVTRLILDGRGEDLFVGTSAGQIIRYDLRDRAAPRQAEAAGLGPGRSPVTALAFLNGDRTLIAGNRAGQVSSWQVIPPAAGGARRLTRIHQFPSQDGAVVGISVSRRDKGFVTADPSGAVHLSYGTSGQTLLALRHPGGALRAVAYAPKADGLVALDGRGTLAHWQLRNPHPEVTWRTLFGKVWYEGYARPEYVWQSTGGTDDFEAKLSLTPLLYGTLKGTFYALLIAIPLALLGAVYVSEFMHPELKAILKPVVEIMAALPSVVLGFLAGLWLAPALEPLVPGLFLAPLVLPACVLGALLLWRGVPLAIRGRLRTGAEVFLLMPVVLLGLWIAFRLGGLVETTLLGGNYRGWLLSALGLTYDQRNSLVVGVAMGFAVIPIIFTIAEDSLANVPGHLRAGSLALGATRWQTALRIVLPTASPGIFSAIMIGFGRAVGETMIVLMATGNTPVMEWSIFNGFRALSANIAVELPEAPEGGTLFRVLFLAAFLLFCLTFAVNTVAEAVRLRLRRKYRYL